MKKTVILIAVTLLTGTAFADCKVNNPKISGSYTGGCKNGLAHGYGTAVGENKYQGNFRDGNIHATGTYTWSNGHIYKGDWLNNKMSGTGTFTRAKGRVYPDGMVYKGGWLNNKKHGSGIQTWGDGNFMRATWINGEIEEQDQKTYSQGDSFTQAESNVVLQQKIDLSPFGIKNSEVAFIVIKTPDGSKRGVINTKTGQNIIEPIYDRIQFYTPDMSIVILNEKYGLVDNKGEDILPPKYDYIKFNSSKVLTKLNGKYGFVDYRGKQLISNKYDRIEGGSEGLYAVTLNGKAGYINKNEEMIIEAKYDYTRDFIDGVAWTETNDKYSLIDKQNRTIVPPIYDSARDFTYDLSVVSLNDKHGFINKQGDVVIPLKYDSALPFKNGVAKVYIFPESNSNGSFCIDVKENIVQCVD